ncbi:hypothetical protein EZV62_020708 [Acer yangbiense]|uniref:Leucine-rich repeat-containing N-terminal plant-type domain-containing protein n=1 Tax=Acer yangbiense TaxID=1000413 RepID=A0A5C7HGG6_9ROSI|nr:hypothetical protein EZV62_020708 [Acer yangbiense]
MFVTKNNMANAVATVLENVSEALAVSEMKSNLSEIRLGLDSIFQMVSGMEDKLQLLEDKQDVTNTGLLYLCQVAGGFKNAQNIKPFQPLCHDDERYALLQFKQSFLFGKDYCSNVLISDYPKVESWKIEGGNSSSADCCSWDGVKCDEETGHVIKLDLTSSCLYGSINSTTTLFHLVHLQWLSLANNDFDFSEIPAAINNLSRLSHLNLSSSAISGQIPPQLLDLRNLVSLDLSGNSFIEVPGNETHYLELGELSLQNLVEKLTNLKVLNLDRVQISSPIPHILANLSSLTYLSLQDCGLQGEFPSKIFLLPNLSVLQLSYNSNLTGYLPEIERSSPLTVLAIGSCGFSGTIPSSLGNLTKLVHLDFSFSSFLGELPISIGNLASLKELDLQGCNFSGQISSSILSNLTQLDYLDLSQSHNKFSGQNSSSLSWIAKNTKLKLLYLSNLNLVGEIPLWLMNLTQLIDLDMSRNQLTGPIPSCLMNINQLSSLYLQSNQLTRNIPSEIRNLTRLVDLDLSSNSLQGPIPINIFQLKKLLSLKLRSNNLSGTVEFDMFLSQLESLEILILSSNNLSVLMNNTDANTNSHKFRSIGLRSCNLSHFPNFLHNQDFLRVLDLSSNSIIGKIPGWFLNDSAPHLRYLNLSHNLFTEFDQHPNVKPPYLFTLDLRYFEIAFCWLFVIENLKPVDLFHLIVFIMCSAVHANAFCCVQWHGQQNTLQTQSDEEPDGLLKSRPAMADR